MIFLLTLAGCSQGMVRVDAIEDLTEQVASRHDVYVNSDEALSEAQKRTYLRSTELLREVIREAKEG